MNEVRFEDYVPHCTDEFLKTLYSLKDCLRRQQYKEACLYTSEIIAKVQNEIDWCYRTDPVLGYMRHFLAHILTTVNTLDNVQPSAAKELLQQLIRLLDETQQEIAQLSANLPRWPAPAGSVDSLELEYRKSLYKL